MLGYKTHFCMTFKFRQDLTCDCLNFAWCVHIESCVNKYIALTMLFRTSAKSNVMLSQYVISSDIVKVP